jgi:thioredoxin-related protein
MTVELRANAIIDRRHFLTLACLVSSYAVQAQSAGQAVLPVPHSLQYELTKAIQQKQVLIVMVSLEGCPFCRIARASYLGPMQKAGMPIVQLDMRSTQAVLDFQGHKTTHDQLIKQWRIAIAPTLLFFGSGGKEVAERMEGGYLPDFYGPYLEERISKARQAF